MIMDVSTDTDVRCPPVEKLLSAYFSYLIESGFMPPPAIPTNNLNINWKKIEEGVEQLTRTKRS